jgi:DNA-binding FadR family transcriptional regulator
MHGRIVAALRDKSAAEARRLMKESLKGWKEDMMTMHFQGHFDGKRENQ